jgi:hypothetical protein
MTRFQYWSTFESPLNQGRYLFIHRLGLAESMAAYQRGRHITEVNDEVYK